MNKIPEALRDYSRSINTDPEYALAYHYRGILRFRIGDNDGALEDYDKAAALGLSASALHYNRAVILQKKKRYAEAILEYGKCIAIDPSAAICYYNRATAYIAQNKTEKALEDLNIASKLGHAKACRLKDSLSLIRD